MLEAFLLEYLFSKCFEYKRLIVHEYTEGGCFCVQKAAQLQLAYHVI